MSSFLFSPQNIVLSLEDRDAEELVLVLCGYHRLLAPGASAGEEETELEVIRQKSELEEDSTAATAATANELQQQGELRGRKNLRLHSSVIARRPIPPEKSNSCE